MKKPEGEEEKKDGKADEHNPELQFEGKSKDEVAKDLMTDSELT